MSVVKGASLSWFWSQRESFQYFTMEYEVSCGFFINTLYRIEEFSLYSYCPEGFYHERCCIFVKCLLCAKRLFFFITLIDFLTLKQPCITEINPTWSWQIILLICSWVQFDNILLRFFTFICIRDIHLFSFVKILVNFFFFWCLYLSLVSG